MSILAGDIGGTKTHLALFSSGKFLASEKFPSKNFQCLEEIVLQFLSRNGQKIERACFGVAGPVQNGRCQTTNLPWIIEASKLAEVIGIDRVDLLNDLEANAYGISCLKGDELVALNRGEQVQGNAALLSAGTGLGEACLYWNGKTHIPFASEGGHSSFGPENEMEIELWRYLKHQFNHVSCERVLSGEGLVNIYRFLVESGQEKENEEIHRSETPAQLITEFGLEGKCRACKRVLDHFVEMYGSEAGNLALKMLAIGGLYIGGGIAPKILPVLRLGRFLDRMRAKGRFAPFLSKIPVRIILNENTALLGAIKYAQIRTQILQ